MFDDNKVFCVDVQQNIVTTSAYILFYVQVDESAQENASTGSELVFSCCCLCGVMCCDISYENSSGLSKICANLI